MITGIDNDKIIIPNGFINGLGYFQSVEKIDLWYPFGYVVPLDWDYLQVMDAIDCEDAKVIPKSTSTSLCLIVNANSKAYIAKIDKHKFQIMAYPSGRGIQKVFGCYSDVPTIVEAIVLLDNLSVKSAITRYIASTSRNNNVFMFKERKISGIVAELKKRNLTDAIPIRMLVEAK